MIGADRHTRNSVGFVLRRRIGRQSTATIEGPMDRDNWILSERRGAAGIITINRPDVFNAWDRGMLLRAEEMLGEFERDPAVHAVILTGAGPKAFLAGGDIADLNTRRSIAHYTDMAEVIHRVYRRFERCEKVTIGAINGLALGGGFEILLCLDFRLLADHARLGLPEINLGIFPGAGGTQRLIRQIPLCKAKELLLLGESISAEQALSLGLANRVVPRDDLMTEALALAEKIATKSPLVVKMIRELTLNGADMPLNSALYYEKSMISLAFESEDKGEGCSAFLDKRPPRFTGR
jgi:enoyl-CoA hydratase